MSSVDEWISSAREKYDCAKEFLAEAKNDPTSDPYHSKYKAKKLFCELDIEASRLPDASGNLKLRCLSALFNFQLGVISMETEDLHASEVFLDVSWEKIQDLCELSECCVLAINILNYLGILWSNRGEHSKACKYLKRAEEIYEKYRNENETCPLDFGDLFLPPDYARSESWELFEKSFTYTGYFLAQVYEELNENNLAAKYCFNTLKRQEMNDIYDPVEWATNTATLSQYFIAKNEFEIGKHLLACASHALTKQELKLKEELENKEHESWETFNRAKAEVSHFWLKYCVTLFLFSLEKEVENQPNANVVQSDQSVTAVEKKWLPEKLLENDAILELEKSIFSNTVSNYEEARLLFLFAQNYVNEAKTYYTLNSYANDHVQLVQEHSKLYKYLIFYEADVERQCKMHKRRADILEDALNKLNPQFYLSVCRQLQFELGEIFGEMMSLKMQLANSEPSEMPISVAKKINSLIMRSLSHFQGFLDTVRDKNKSLPETFPEELVRPALIAHCYIGRCYYKLIELQKEELISNLYKSKEYYDFIESYVERNPNHSNLIEKELEVVKDMTQLLEKKIVSLNNACLF